MGELKMHKPLVYQEVAGVRKKVAAAYVLNSGSEVSALNSQLPTSNSTSVGFQVASYDLTKPLVIDPVFVYSTYLGGNDTEDGYAIAVDSSGNAYITGWTQSTDFATANALQATHGGGFQDAFVTKLNANGSAIVYSTYLGGSDSDSGFRIAVDSSGNAYITGSTGSTNFPTANALQATYGGNADAFVTKLNTSGSALVYSTYLGGNNADIGFAIAVDSPGNTYITGATLSTNFPTVNALQTTSNGEYDAFVTKLNTSGSALVYSTYLGGNSEEHAIGIAVDSSGNAYVTGFTGSTNFPTANAFQATFGGDMHDAFVTKLNTSGSALVYSTYLGGNNADIGLAIAVDSSGNAHITGHSASTNFPTANALQPTLTGSLDAFVTKLNANGSALVYSTYLGGSGAQIGLGIATDSSGNTYIAGETSSNNFPTASPLQAALGGGDGQDAFVTKLNANGSVFVYSTYLGGPGFDSGRAIAVDSSGNAYITGVTQSTNFPTANALQATLKGDYDVFVTKIEAKAAMTSPIESPRITQDFACYNCFRDGYTIPFHTGLDMKSKSAPDTNTIVSASEAGRVHRIYFSRDRTNTICDLNNPANDIKVTTLVPLNLADLDPVYQNHGLGNTVLLRNEDNLFTLYAHLDCIEQRLAEDFLSGADTPVTQGQAIGRMGGSGLSSLAAYTPHLHFEIKTAGVLNAPNNTDGKDYGYSTDPPNTLGNSDPVLFISDGAPVELDPTQVVRVRENDVKVRPGPGYDDYFNQLRAGTELVAFRKMTVDGALWHQVHLAVPISNLINCGTSSTTPQCNNDGTEGWVSDSLLETLPSAIKVQIGSARAVVKEDRNGSPGTTNIGYIFRSQEFVIISAQNAKRGHRSCPDSTWYKIYLGNIRTPTIATQGWVCGKDLVF
jgi:murein DD-endopeptidase MepM/ murein hydrolase activator NlpD